MSLITVLALTYIHMQMQIVDLAYKGNQNEQRIKKLIEDNGSATYRILMLKSANHLGVTMLEEDSDMQFADANDVVQIVTAEEILTEDQLDQSSKLAKRSNPLFNLLSFGVEAQAKTAE
jgi:hypothetical protein